MKIVILDGHAVNPSDISWKQFEDLGDVTVYSYTKPEDVIKNIDDAEIVITNKTVINSEVFQKCKNIRYVGVLATGYNVVDLEEATKNNIVVTNVPSYSTAAVAQAVFAFILEFSNLVKLHSDSVFNGDWVKSLDFCYWKKPLVELEGKTLGILGFGNIGNRVSKIALAFGMNVICNTRSPEKLHNTGVKAVSLDELFSSSDYLTLHAPLTEKTKKIVNSDSLSKIKKSLILINTARGPLVDEAAVCKALCKKQLAGYACDVVEVEPMKPDNPLLKAPNCLITPHIAWAPKETRERLLNIASCNIKAFLSGTVENKVNK